jgi:glyoxylase-like metal-dependent hydrolase (beta-lactamase superfamily II)
MTESPETQPDTSEGHSPASRNGAGNTVHLEIFAMKKWGIAAALLVALCIAGASAASAQDIKAYWLASGTLKTDQKIMIPSLPGKPINIPVSMWVIDHPKGLIVYDTGNNVAVSDGKCETHWVKGACAAFFPTQTRADVIDMQLKKLGYSVDQVKIVITSHAHLDHIGNIEMFPNATHVIQKKELYQAWWPEKFQRGGAFVMADIDGAREFKYLELDGDYDLFGDGSVRILSTPGHTMAHQSVAIRLKSGVVIPTGDAIWLQAMVEGGVPSLNYSLAQVFGSIQRLTAIRDVEGAQLVYGHDPDQWATLPKEWK